MQSARIAESQFVGVLHHHRPENCGPRWPNRHFRCGLGQRTKSQHFATFGGHFLGFAAGAGLGGGGAAGRGGVAATRGGGGGAATWGGGGGGAAWTCGGGGGGGAGLAICGCGGGGGGAACWI